MDITPTIPKSKQVITGYGAGQFKVSGTSYSGSIIVFPDRVIVWSMTENNTISLAHIVPVLEAEGTLDILLIGCHARQKAMPAQIKNTLREAGISLEIMDTGAAVRTYNVLLAEGRNVAAALVAI